MMAKPKAPTCHLDISLRLMRDSPGIDNLHFCTSLIYRILQKVVIGKPITCVKTFQKIS
jgi:hypothetical protein